ncbi:MAG: hypothetical protein ACFFCS_17040 [Candidatus Hodarchaeota archaeon]
MRKQYYLFDLHCHTPFSDAQRDLDTIIQGLIDIGIEIVGFADHINPVSLYRNPKRFGDQRRLVFTYSPKLLRYRKEVFRIYDKKYKKICILNGGEIDIYPQGGISLPRGIKPDFFDYLLLSKHHTVPPIPQRFKEYMWEAGLYQAFRRYKPDVFAHPHEGIPKRISREKLKRMVFMAKKHGVAIELNHCNKDMGHYKIIFEYGHEYGVKFSLASDFHGFSNDIQSNLLESQKMLEYVEKYDLELLDPRKFLKNKT